MCIYIYTHIPMYSSCIYMYIIYIHANKGRDKRTQTPWLGKAPLGHRMQGSRNRMPLY